MFSQRFKKPIVITRHAQMRMDQRSISPAELLVVIDTGDTRFKDETQLWVYKNLSD